MRKSLEAATIGLSIMTAPGVQGELATEESLMTLMMWLKFVIMDCILPLHEETMTTSDDKETKLRIGKLRKVPSGPAAP